MKKITIAFLSLMIILSACRSAADVKRDEKARYTKIRARSDWSEDDQFLIIEHKIKIGFTKEMVIESWGLPNKINRTIMAGAVHEQAVYGSYKYDAKVRYLYFDNGILTAIQD